MAWIKSDPEVVAQRASEVRIRLVLLLADVGNESQDIADMVNDHFEELVVLTECMGDWSPNVLAQAMFARITETEGDE